MQDLHQYCKKSVGFIGILEKPFIWNKAMVKVIILIKTKREGDHDLPILCNMLSNYLSDSVSVAALKEEKDFKFFLDRFLYANS